MGKGTTAVSLDVFDTALTRACGPPEALFLLLGNLLHADDSLSVTPEVFARARRRAEAVVWDREGGLDARVSLWDFYTELARTLPLSEAEVEAYVSAELDLERRMLRPVPATAALVHRLPAAMGLVYLSDSYFSSRFIAEQLDRFGLRPRDAPVISSLEHDASKASGALFDVALRLLDRDAEEVVHRGDNPLSDVSSARGAGLQVRPYVTARQNRYEALLSNEAFGTGGLGASFAGASRLARLHVPAAGDDAAVIRDVAAGVAAPLLVGYVTWLLQRAATSGLQRLYFISRDGQIMADVARRLVTKLGLSLEIHYLYASRGAVNLATSGSGSDDDLGWVRRDLDHLTPASLLASLDITWDEGAPHLGHEQVSPDAPPGSSATWRTFESIRSEPALRELLHERAARRRELVVDYLRQEGVFGAGRCGLVDFGGVGSQMRALHTLVAEESGTGPKLYLVGLDDPNDERVTPGPTTHDWLADTECYLYDHRRGGGLRRPRGFGTCVQMFCAATHGTVVGYRRADDAVVPIVHQDRDVELERWGLPVLQSTVTEFLEHLILDDDLVDPFADVREVSVSSIQLFWTDPTVDEARSWGRFPFEGAQASSLERKPLAYPYTWPMVVRRLRDGSFPDLGWLHWFEGSLRLSPRTIYLAGTTAMRSYRSLLDRSRRSSSVRRVLTIARRTLRRGR